MEDEHFYELLEKAIKKEITFEEDCELCEDYLSLYLDPLISKKFIKIACDKNYVPAYYCMGKLLSIEEEWLRAIEYFEKSVAGGEDGYVEIGDFFRLGKGVEKNYDIAWQYYERAVIYNHERGEYPEPAVLLLQQDNELNSWEKTVSNEWWEYAIERTNKSSSYNICNFMIDMYDIGEERFLYWNKKASEQGILAAKLNLYEITDNILTKKQLVKEIFNATEWTELQGELMIMIAKEILKNAEFSHDEKLPVFQFVYNSIYWEYVFDFYKKDENELELFLRDIEK